MDTSKCVIYLRVSSKQQAESDRDGYPRQRQALTDYAAANGLEIVAEFKDSITGATEGEDRKGWADLIEFLRSDGVSIVLIEKLDRLARDLMVQEAIIKQLQSEGFQLKSLSDPDLCSADPTRKLLRQLLGAVAEYEKSLIVGRTHRKGGKPTGTRPYGFLPGEKAVIDTMLAMRADGKSAAKIALALNNQGLRPRGRVRAGVMQGEAWGEVMVSKILRRHQSDRVDN
jgi:DNA invertase Pin-like site-specific DNA recombinase